MFSVIQPNAAPHHLVHTSPPTSRSCRATPFTHAACPSSVSTTPTPPPPLRSGSARRYNLGSTMRQAVPLHTSGLCSRPRVLQSQAKVQNQDFLSFHLVLVFLSHSSNSLLLILAQPCPGPCPRPGPTRFSVCLSENPACLDATHLPGCLCS